MSGTSGSGYGEDQAALYVLGALNAEEMRDIRRAAEKDSELAAGIAEWERRLMPLIQLLDPVAPPETLWAQLEARLSRISGVAEKPGEIYLPPVSTRKTRRRASSRALNAWRAAALGAMAVAAGLGTLLYLQRRPPPELAAMLLPAKPGIGGWLLQIRPDGLITAYARGALPRALSQDYELWVLPEDGDHPTAVGLLPVTGSARLRTINLPSRHYQLLVSLEPKGGSPSGLPTGPVLFGGAPPQE